MAWLESVFVADFQNGIDFKPNQAYSQSEMAIIKDPSRISYSIPPPYTFSGSYDAQMVTSNEPMDFQLIASPDSAFEVFMDLIFPSYT